MIFAHDEVQIDMYSRLCWMCDGLKVCDDT